MKASKKRVPRAKQDTKSERVVLGIVATEPLKDRLLKAARTNHRTLSQEAAYRLDRSFEQTSLLPEILELQYGAELAGLMIAIGDAMSMAATISRDALEEEDRPFGSRLALEGWTTSAFVFNEAREAVHELMRLAAPVGDIWPAQIAEHTGKFEGAHERPGDFGKDAARLELRLLKQAYPEHHTLTRKIQSLVKPILDRAAQKAETGR
jgi:hypothetical protein